MAVVPAMPRPGDRLGGFRIERELGRGTTGVVFLAHQEALGRDVALKVVGPPLAEDEALRERVRHEARTVAGLDHPNVVQILETGEDDHHLWLAMRYVAGPDLRVLLRRTGRLDPEQAVVVVEQVAAALDAAHAAGVVHRDVTPGNVLIEDGPGRDLHVELADFGLARAPGPEDAGGTPGYAAPEQLAGAPATPAADVYGLGCLLFALLTGLEPTAAADGDAGLRPSLALPRLGGAFDPTVERATDPDPARRFATAGELALWARAALAVPTAGGAPETRADDLRAAAAAPASLAEVGPSARTWEAPPRPRRRRTRSIAVPLLVLLLAALATAFVFLDRTGDSSGGRFARGGSAGAGTPLATTPRGASRSGGTAAGAGSGSNERDARAATGPAGAADADGAGGRGGEGRAAGSAGGRGTGASGAGAGAAGASRGTERGRGAASGGEAGDANGPAGGRGVGGVARSSSDRRSDGDGRGSDGSGATGGAPSASSSRSVAPPTVAGDAPGNGTAAALPPVAPGNVRFGGGFWVLDLPAAQGWRQTSSRERDGGARIVTRLARPDGVGMVVEQLPGRTAVFGPAPGAAFTVRLPGTGRVTAALFRGGRYALCAAACVAIPANGPSGGVLLLAGAHRADGARRVARRAAAGLRVR